MIFEQLIGDKIINIRSLFYGTILTTESGRHYELVRSQKQETDFLINATITKIEEYKDYIAIIKDDGGILRLTRERARSLREIVAKEQVIYDKDSTAIVRKTQGSSVYYAFGTRYGNQVITYLGYFVWRDKDSMMDHCVRRGLEHLLEFLDGQPAECISD